ncbi:MAG TPA: hypothetical protein VLH15_03840 [Dehalococcoidales bacterium]|nr:hypothetical protein [Dehalococcoidales bacterium]
MKKLFTLVTVLFIATALLLTSAGAAFATGSPPGQSGTLIKAWITDKADATRTFQWTIQKTVDVDSWVLNPGESGTSTYKIAVQKDGGIVTASVTGEVKVKNTGSVATKGLAIVLELFKKTGNNNWTLVSTTPVNLGTNTVIDKDKTVEYPYSLNIPSPVVGDSYKIIAKVTITNYIGWIGTPKGDSPDDTFKIPSPKLVNDTINVDDTNGMEWKFSASGVKTYTKKFFYCFEEEYVNTATIRETGASSTVTVKSTSVLPSPLASDIWYLNQIPHNTVETRLEMEKISNMQLGQVILSAGETKTWLADQAAMVNVTFPAGKWVLTVRTSQDWSNDLSATIGVWDVTSLDEDKYTALIKATSKTFDKATNSIRVEFEAPSITIMKGNYLALQIYNSSSQNSNVITCFSKGGSTLAPPKGSPPYPVPELSAGMLLGLGLLGLAAVMIIKRRKAAKITG